MRQYLISILLFALFLLTNTTSLLGQCTQCKSAAASKDEAGNLYVGAGMNAGVLYLLVLPFAAILLIGGYWFYRSYKAGSGQETQTSL